ncbi:hypothetical protein GGR10_001393 [Bartonella chomelii]|uniref:Uncharacterized protein n=1 Tax=Bartonella chomelii TaxID=236402 RepID=A0ABR6E5U9_9HYPH|nr:hypothetical protein [Bartonella chomelii]
MRTVITGQNNEKGAGIIGSSNIYTRNTLPQNIYDSCSF